ncbi:MFS transporter [Kribbella sp. NPDC051620]|uniref:MFS transporter n=1 Tax=Kribbella sp. NPDC051620 TaxID=3364120 RepID=UPI00379FAD0F
MGNSALLRVQVGNSLSAFGHGFTIIFLFIYVSEVRGLGPAVAGAVMSTLAVAALFALPFAGRVVDRKGPIPVAVGGAVGAAAGAAGLGLSSAEIPMFISASLLGASMAIVSPALATLIVHCTTTATRSRAFAVQFFLNNLGMGMGGLVGGFVADPSSPSSFLLLFLGEAAMFLVLGAITVSIRLPGSELEPADARRALDDSPHTSARVVQEFTREGHVLRDRRMLLICVLGFVLFFVCYGQFESGLPAYAVESVGLSTKTLGLALTANTVLIVLSQFVILKLTHGRRRSSVIALVGLLWFVAWLLAGLATPASNDRTAAGALIITTYALFGIGEAMLSPTLGPLVADIAPANRIGSYNATFTFFRYTAQVCGPVVGGLLIGAGLHTSYIVVLTVAALLVSVLALTTRRLLAREHDRPTRAVVT